MHARPLDWRVGHTPTRDATPRQFVPARVPGAPQLDWASASGWPPYWQGENSRNFGWMEEVFWIYEATLDLSGAAADEQSWFECGGIDYEWEILLGHSLLERREGMFSPVAINLTSAGARHGDTLRIIIHPPPKKHRNGEDRWQADQTCKPPCSYGWDWHPRLIPSGLWEETRIRFRRQTHIRDFSHRYVLDANARTASLEVIHLCEGPDPANIRITLIAPDGKLLVDALQPHATPIPAAGHHAPGESTSTASIHQLHDLQLWWPHDHGPQPLYKLTLELLGTRGEILDSASRKIGFRRAKLVMNPPEWSHPKGFPKSRSLPPITLEINGRTIFAKGSNWLPPEIFPGNIDRARYHELLTLARHANFNLLRCWGGAIVNKDSFYELCDEMGLMVWTEFTMACLPYADDPHHLAVLENEARAIIPRIAAHPSQVLWCGGNELFNGWSGMTDQSHPLRLLNALCYELDPDTPFLPTSPVEGMAHGHYLFRDADGTEAYEIFRNAAYTAYTEYAIPSPSSVEVLQEIIPPEELWPPRTDGSWKHHHAHHAWIMVPDTWLVRSTIEHYFGTCENLAQLVDRGQWLQSEGLKFIYEEARRQKPKCSMALNWCFNEPWPTAANTSLINWPARPKPALDAVASACRPVSLSLRIPRFLWHNQDRFDAEVWLLNDRHEAAPPAEVLYHVRIGDWHAEIGRWSAPEAAPDRNLQGPSLVLDLPKIEGASTLEITLECPDHPDRNQSYRLAYRPDRGTKLYGPAARRAMNA